MAQLPQIVPIPTAAGSVSYDYTDIAEGTGITNYYGCTAETSGAATYHLLTKAFYSKKIETTCGGTATTTINFDTMPFNFPKDIKGTAYASVPFYRGAGGTMYATFQLKVSGASAISNVTDALEIAAYPVNTQQMEFMKMPCTQTHIKRGDILRFALVIYAAGADNPTVGHDPKNRDGAHITPSVTASMTSTMIIGIPFRINVT